MIVGTYFDGDNDDRLKMIQHACYYDMLREWITLAGIRRLKYRKSPEWVALTQMWEQFREGGCFDHRKIQMAHDMIAARFRMLAQELALPDDEKEVTWYAFYKAEAAAWLLNDDFLRCFMIALSDKGSSDGYDAEETILDIMRKQYIELL